MNRFNPESTKELQRMVLNRFDAAFTHENIFEKRRKEILKAEIEEPLKEDEKTT